MGHIKTCVHVTLQAPREVKGVLKTWSSWRITLPVCLPIRLKWNAFWGQNMKMNLPLRATNPSVSQAAFGCTARSGCMRTVVLQVVKHLFRVKERAHHGAPPNPNIVSGGPDRQPLFSTLAFTLRIWQLKIWVLPLQLKKKSFCCSKTQACR